jgi:hypothetical protein
VRSRTQQNAVGVLVIVALIAAAFVLLAANYKPMGAFEVDGDPPTRDTSVALDVNVLGVNPGEYGALLRLRVTDVEPRLLNPDGRLAEPLRIAVTSSDGTEDVIFPAGSAPGRAEASIGLTGVESSYPFDSHTSSVEVSAALPGTDESSVTREYLTSSVRIGGGSPGWNTSATIKGQGSDDVFIDLVFVRSGTVKVVTFLVVGIGLILAASALAVGLAIQFGRQRVDSSILGWGAGLFFALLALRFYLPGDPPVGSAVDVFGYLWVMVFAFIGLTLTTMNWLVRRHS